MLVSWSGVRKSSTGGTAITKITSQRLCLGQLAKAVHLKVENACVIQPNTCVFFFPPRHYGKKTKQNSMYMTGADHLSFLKTYGFKKEHGVHIFLNIIPARSLFPIGWASDIMIQSWNCPFEWTHLVPETNQGSPHLFMLAGVPR